MNNTFRDLVHQAKVTIVMQNIVLSSDRLLQKVNNRGLISFKRLKDTLESRYI